LHIEFCTTGCHIDEFFPDENNVTPDLDVGHGANDCQAWRNKMMQELADQMWAKYRPRRSEE
jgi:hypothetical protein